MELNRELYIKGVSDYLENGKNIFDKGSQYVYKTIINPITITEQNTGIKIEYTATDIFSGAFVLYNLGLASKYAGKPITCSANVVLNSNTRGKLTIGLISNDGSTRNILQNGEEITSNTEGYSVSATIPSTISSSTPYLGVWVYFNNNATGSVSIEYSNLQVEEGLGATSYEPHKKYVTKDYLENGKNLWNYNATNTIVGVTSTYNNSTLTLNGTATGETSNISHTNMVYLKSGTYTFKIAKESGSATGSQAIFFKNYTTNTNILNTTLNLSSGNTVTFTLQNSAWVSLAIYFFNSNVFTNLKLDIQLEEGSSATPYEEYYGKYLNKGDGILIPYTLYENSSGTNGNITISENFSNYKEFDVYVANQYGSRRKIERLFYSSDTSKNYTILTYGASANASMSLSATTFNLSGNTLSILNSVTATLKTPPEYNTTNTNYIQKIVGYK